MSRMNKYSNYKHAIMQLRLLFQRKSLAVSQEKVLFGAALIYLFKTTHYLVANDF